MHQPDARFASLLLPALAVIAACSDAPPLKRQQAELARYQAYAEAPVERIAYLGNYDGWTALSPTDLILWTTPRDPYLIKVSTPCTDLSFARHVSLESAVAHNVQTRFDYVKAKGWRCPIQEIRPVDYARMQADARSNPARQAHEATAVTRAN
jgi:hypothetical protein